MFIHASAQFITPPVENLRTLKEILKGYTDTPVRRVNKFILLALIGSHRCAQDHSLNKRTAVYLTTEIGNLSDTANVLDQIYRQHSLPMPFSFINTMSNTASFYVAQSLQALGRNISLSSKDLCFERGLELACLDFDLRITEEALIGAVDEVVVTEHDVGQDVEGSCWLYVKRTGEGALAEVLDIRSFPDRGALTSWWEEGNVLPPGKAMLSCGASISEEEKKQWQTLTDMETVFDYVADHGPFETVTAYGITKFIGTCRDTVLLHINKNRQDQYVALIVRRF